MQYLLAFLAVVAVVVFYVWLCVLAVEYVVVPSLPWLVAIGAVAGTLLVVGVLVAGLLGTGPASARLVTPGEALVRLPKVKVPRGRDRAWANYLFLQARDDLRAALTYTGKVVAVVWTWTIGLFVQAPVLLIAGTLLALPAVVLIAGTVAVVVAGAGIYGVLLAVLGVAWLAWLLAVGVLRAVDRGVRTLRRARASCPYPDCNGRSEVPGYRCRCGAVIHFDVRAGRQGLFRRRCECGRTVPTTVLGAALRLVPVCQRCERDLHAGAAVTTDIVLPVFGPASAGKTRLVLAGTAALGRHLAAVHGSLRAADAHAETTLAGAETIVATRAPTQKTPVTPPAAISVRLTAGRRRALLHLFDAAGEFYADREQTGRLKFFDDGVQGLVFVLDPFSMRSVAARLRGTPSERVAEAAPAREEPDDAYRVTALWLRDLGADLTRVSLAVAVVKFDLLQPLAGGDAPDPDGGSADVRRWLCGNDLDGLVEEMERDFAEVSYHLVSSLGTGEAAGGVAGRCSPAWPLLWLLGRSGFPVPESQQAVAS